MLLEDFAEVHCPEVVECVRQVSRSNCNELWEVNRPYIQPCDKAVDDHLLRISGTRFVAREGSAPLLSVRIQPQAMKPRTALKNNHRQVAVSA
jgi:hypothetical protein